MKLKRIIPPTLGLLAALQANASTYTYDTSSLTSLDHTSAYTWGLTLDLPADQTITSATLTIKSIYNWNSGPNSLFIDLLNTAAPTQTTQNKVSTSTEVSTRVNHYEQRVGYAALSAKGSSSTTTTKSESTTISPPKTLIVDASKYQSAKGVVTAYKDNSNDNVLQDAFATPMEIITSSNTKPSPTVTTYGAMQNMGTATRGRSVKVTLLDQQQTDTKVTTTTTSILTDTWDATSLTAPSFGTTKSDYVWNFTEGQIKTLLAYLQNGDDFGLSFDPDCHYYDSGIKLTLQTAHVPEVGYSLGMLGFGFLSLLTARNKWSQGKR